jgi:hypothetical protein
MEPAFRKEQLCRCCGARLQHETEHRPDFQKDAWFDPVWSTRNDTERAERIREDQSPDWWPVQIQGHSFFILLRWSTVSTVQFFTIPQFHSSYFMFSFTTYSWAKAIWLGPFASRGKECKTVGITCVIICSMLFTSRYLVVPWCSIVRVVV